MTNTIDVDHVAKLARLELSDAERQALSHELKAVLRYVAMLDEIDTSDIPPTSHPIPLETPFRDDITEPPMQRDEAVANAPESDGEAFIVPRVV